MNETSAAYKVALERSTTPTVICCTRTNVPALELSTIDKACRGAYAVVEAESPGLVLVATGSEVGICIKAANTLESEGVSVRVVSMPCQEVFLEQSEAYQRSVLPGDVPTLSVEASMDHGWHRFSHAQVSMHGFGASGDGAAVFAKFGFTADNVTAKARVVLDFYKKASVPDLRSRPVFEAVMNGH
jgi:transketolase